MKKALFCLVLLMLCYRNISAQYFNWAKSAGGAGQDQAYGIAIGLSGSVYVTGAFGGTADFDPGPGVYNLTNTGLNNNLFVLKLDASGNFIWAKAIGGSSAVAGFSIALDASENVYLTGYFYGSNADFDPGPGVYTLNGNNLNSSIFVEKLDSAGNFIWAKAMTGQGSAFGNSIAVDDASNIYVTGAYRSTIDFDPDTGAYILTSVDFDDMFLLKLGSAGNHLWVNSTGSYANDEGKSLTLDANGDIYVTGWFGYGADTVDFDPGAGIHNLICSGMDDVFIQKVDASGQFLWAHSFGGPQSDFGISVAVDTFGNVILSGVFTGVVDFNPGSGVSNLTGYYGAFNDNALYFLKLNAMGDFIWAKAIDGTHNIYGSYLATDYSGNIYASGFFSHKVDFDPGSDTSFITDTYYNPDVYVLKLDSSGDFTKAGALSGRDITWGSTSYAIAVDDSGNVFVTGKYNGTVDFNPGIDSFSHTSQTFLEDIFILKLGINEITQPCNGSITSEPDDVVVLRGESATFVSTANNPATYQWQTDAGLGWQDVSNGGQYAGVDDSMLSVSFVTDSNDNQSFRCIVTFGVDCADTSETAVLTVEIPSGIHNPFSQIPLRTYTNPLTGKLNIEFTLADDSRVKLEIFNLAGQRVVQLFEGDAKGGEIQNFEFNPDKLADGMVIYRLQTDHDVFFGKAVMVK